MHVSDLLRAVFSMAIVFFPITQMSMSFIFHCRFFETMTHCVTQAVLELGILLQPLTLSASASGAEPPLQTYTVQ